MKKGFTLAEVLITIVLIGIVASLTMPSMVHNASKHKYEVATKKFYLSMTKAIQKYMVDQGVYDLRQTELGSDDDNVRQAALNNFVRKYFHVVKECGYSNADECFSSKFKNLNGSVFDGQFLLSGSTKAFVLSDGTVLTLQSWGPIYVHVDVNGKSKPNVVGYDVWNMDIFYDGSIDESSVDPENKKAGRASQIRQSRFEDVCLTEGNYGGCFGHFLENGFKIDY